MADHIPFVNSDLDCRLATEFYADSKVFRLALTRIARLQGQLPQNARLWIDPGVDGFDRPFDASPNRDWQRHMRRFPEHTQIGDRQFQSKPDSSRVQMFVEAILNKCIEYNPKAISVPQLPMVDDVSRNRINRTLAEATSTWKAMAKYKGKLILPVIFKSQKQLNLKKVRNSKRAAILSSYEKAQADGLWAVDSSLLDQTGSPTFRNARFPAIIAFHEEILQELPDSAITMAGPYWGMNLVLWVRGLCSYPAIGVGSGYQYHVAGGRQRRPNVRLAIPPLRRWAQVGGRFRSWLTDAMNTVGEDDPSHAEFTQLRNNYSTLATEPVSRRQIAQFYKSWYDEIEAVAPAGRALALYQMLSSAYVLGKTLPGLPANEGTARRPERVAEYFMLNCL